jgi:hypothetical protein
VNPDVFLSLLALDAYNRGYGQGVFTVKGDDLTGTDEIDRKIGLATIIADDITQNAQAAGFYAIAYDCKGETIISFRGTNFPNDLRNVTEAEFNAFVAHASARTATAPC